MSDPRIAALADILMDAMYAKGYRNPKLFAAEIVKRLPPDWCGHVPREGSRLVEVAIEVFRDWIGRTEDGRALTMEWGKPDERGMYTPVWTLVDDGKEMVDRAEVARYRRIEEAVERMAASGVTGDQDEEESDFWFAVNDAFAALEASE